eukprot:Gb_34151 [translate_table: standard]
MLISVSEAMKQASFFMPFILYKILLHSILDARLPVPQSMAKLLIMKAWCNVYGRGVITSQNVATWIEKMQLVVKSLEIDSKRTPVNMVKSRNLVIDSFHGQETSLRKESAAEEVRRKKGKNIAEGHDTQRTSQDHMQDKIADKLLQLSTWTVGIPDGFIHLDYKDRWKIFEDGLPKEE